MLNGILVKFLPDTPLTIMEEGALIICNKKIIVTNNTAFQVWKKDSGNNWKAVASVMYPEKNNLVKK